MRGRDVRAVYDDLVERANENPMPVEVGLRPVTGDDIRMISPVWLSSKEPNALSGPFTWAGFADAIFDRAGWDRTPTVTPISTADWPTRARRPANSILDCAKIAEVYGIAQPDWRLGLDAVIHELARETA